MPAPGGTTRLFCGFPLSAVPLYLFLFQTPAAAHFGLGRFDCSKGLLPGPFSLAYRLIILPTLQALPGLGEKIGAGRAHDDDAVAAGPSARVADRTGGSRKRCHSCLGLLQFASQRSR